MQELSQADAALLAGFEERAFRSLVEKRILLSTPATRSFGRGKPKMYPEAEVRIGAIINQIGAGVPAIELAEIADFLRRTLSQFNDQIRRKQPVFLRLDYMASTGWKADIEVARGVYDFSGDSYKESDLKRISVMSPLDESYVATRLLLVNLGRVIWWADKSQEELAKVLSDFRVTSGPANA